jgi:hypothetical protein
LRLLEARVRALEVAVKPRGLRKGPKGGLRPPPRYEPGDDRPLPLANQLQVEVMRSLIELILLTDEIRSRELDQPSLIDGLLQGFAAIVDHEERLTPESSFRERYNREVLWQAIGVVAILKEQGLTDAANDE